ncbi:FAD-binding protein [Pseudomonas baetica]|nr:FAD-binding protein [Pseudomonas baetica]
MNRGVFDVLVQVIVREPRKAWPVGSGFSFSALVPTDVTLLSLSYFNDLMDHDPQTVQATSVARPPMSRMGKAMKDVGQAQPNLTDIYYQTLSGAIFTSTHVTSVGFTSYSGCVTGQKLVTAPWRGARQ